MNFLILGLPRSRTAWLANFLTYDGLFCYHEAINGCESIDEYKEKVQGKGDSNTGLMLFDFEKHFPDTKIIVIDSDINSAVRFGREVFNTDIEIEMTIAKKRLDNIKGFHVKLEDINSRLREIWEYVSDTEFNQERANILIDLDVKVLDPFNIDLLAISKFKGTVDVCKTLQ